VQAELVKSIKFIQSDTPSTGCTDIPSNQDSENCKVSCINASLLQGKATVEHLESDVARRLSMLLARPKLDVNMNCNEEDAPFSHCDDSSDCSRNMIKEDWSKLKDSKNPYWSETSYDKMSHIGTTYAMNCESHDNWDSGEDDVEIICLRPNELDKQAIRGEAEWEHVEAAGKLTENYNYSEGFAYISTEIK
jgi:aspartokinase